MPTDPFTLPGRFIWHVSQYEESIMRLVRHDTCPVQTRARMCYLTLTKQAELSPINHFISLFYILYRE